MTVFAFRIADHHGEKLRRIAEREGHLSLSDLLRSIVCSHLEEVEHDSAANGCKPHEQTSMKGLTCPVMRLLDSHELLGCPLDLRRQSEIVESVAKEDD